MKAGLRTGVLALSLMLVSGVVLAQMSPTSPQAGRTTPLPLTPPQAEGPYYPVAKPADQDNDLTRVGAGKPAGGTVIVVSGRVVDQSGRPVPVATVELWQADGNGIYMHPGDSRTNQRDPAFQFFGQAATDKDGQFGFRTVVPGEYGTRPRHFHVKVVRPGKRTHTTQLYFKGDARLAEDFLTRRLGDRLPALLLDAKPRSNKELGAETVLVVE